jgi:hypothetical protein
MRTKTMGWRRGVLPKANLKDLGIATIHVYNDQCIPSKTQKLDVEIHTNYLPS